MSKPKMNTASVLIAAVTLTGPRTDDGRLEVLAGEELTAEKQKAFGLKKDDITALLQRGQVVARTVRAADAGETSETAALKARIDKAEGDARKLDAALTEALTALAERDEKIAELEKQLAEATKPAA